MLIYFAFIFLSATSYLIPSIRCSKRWWIIFNAINCLFLCCGYMCGSDWRQYEPMYEDIDFNNLFYHYYAEPGYYFYMLLGRILSLSFWQFFIITKIICFIIVSNTIYKYSFNYRYLAWTIFLPQAGFYLFIDNPMRNLIASVIFLSSIKYIINRNKIKYFLCCITALSFHLTAIITPLFYYLLNKRITTKNYILAIIIIFSIFSSANIFSTILTKFSSINPFILKKVEWYIIGDTADSGGSAFSIGAILQIIFFFLILKIRKKIEEKENGLMILNGSLIFILIYRLGLTISIFSRLQLYLVIFYVIGICFTLYAFKHNVRIILTFLVIIFAGIIGYKNISANGWKYVPYSNYLVTLLESESLSYSERSNYNLKKTPYKETIPERFRI